MNQATTSLDRLHDIALPASVPWWPPAPGWYVVCVVLFAMVLNHAWRTWQRYRANAYRRAALRELADARDAAKIAELLRRTALAVAPRAQIAEQTGTAWLDWLARHCSAPLPQTVREHLTAGVYGRPIAGRDLNALREYAAAWIKYHHYSPTKSSHQ